MKKDKQRVIFLKGKKTILRPARKEADLENALRWMNDPEVRQFLNRYLPLDYLEEERYFDSITKKPNDLHLAIETLEGVCIGFMGLHNIRWNDRRASTGAVIGEKKYWGRGFGTDAKMALLKSAFHTLNLRKIDSSVMAFNERSLKYSLKCGYKIEGRRREQFYVDGKYWDEVLLTVFREDWEKVWKKYQR